jgi:hypothetical protein
MCSSSKGLLKRLVPFFLTFGAGLLIASFFVPITGPSFGKRRQYIRQLEIENQTLREKVASQESEIRELREDSDDWHSNMDVPPVSAIPVPYDAPMSPPPPPAPHAPAAKGHR